jgi:hypothetical protein
MRGRSDLRRGVSLELAASDTDVPGRTPADGAKGNPQPTPNQAADASSDFGGGSLVLNGRSALSAASVHVRARSSRAFFSASILAWAADRRASSAYCRNSSDVDTTGSLIAGRARLALSRRRLAQAAVGGRRNSMQPRELRLSFTVHNSKNFAEAPAAGRACPSSMGVAAGS